MSTGDMAWASEAGVCHSSSRVLGLSMGHNQWDTVNAHLKLQSEGMEVTSTPSEMRGLESLVPMLSLLLPGRGNGTEESAVSPSADTLSKV